MSCLNACPQPRSGRGPGQKLSRRPMNTISGGSSPQAEAGGQKLPDQHILFRSCFENGYRIDPVRRYGVMPGGNECIFPFRRVSQCLWLIPCLKVNRPFPSVAFRAIRGTSRKCSMQLHGCYKLRASPMLYKDKQRWARCHKDNAMIALGLGSCFIAAAILAAVALLDSIAAHRPVHPLRVF